MTEAEPTFSKAESGNELNSRALAYVLQESYRFSQGEKSPQMAFLAVASQCIRKRPTRYSVEEIYNEFRSINMGSHAKEKLDTDFSTPGDPRYIFTSGGSSVAYKGLDEGVLPMKEIAMGAHKSFAQPDLKSTIEEHIKWLFTERPDPTEYLCANFLVEVMKRDAYYAHNLDGYSVYAFRIPGNGRPGDSHSTKIEDYDNSRRDKFFSYVIGYLVKGTQPENIISSGGIVGEVIDIVRSSEIFKNLLAGTAQDVTIQNEVVPIQKMFDELVERYNAAHSVGKVDLTTMRA